MIKVFTLPSGRRWRGGYGKLAWQFGWHHKYEALATASNTCRAPQRLVARAISGHQAGVLGLAEIAAWYRTPVEALSKELGVPLQRSWEDEAPDDDFLPPGGRRGERHPRRRSRAELLAVGQEHSLIQLASTLASGLHAPGSRAQQVDAQVSLLSTRKVLERAERSGWLRGGTTWRHVYNEMRKYDDGLGPLA